MNSKPVVALAFVGDDVQAAYDYFEMRDRSAGDRFLKRYFSAADRIAKNPRLSPVKFDDYRRALIPKTHLAIYYFEEAARSVIVAVIDARRHPRLIRDAIRARREN